MKLDINARVAKTGTNSGHHIQLSDEQAFRNSQRVARRTGLVILVEAATAKSCSVDYCRKLDRCCEIRWLLKKSVFLKKVENRVIENVQAIVKNRL